MIKFLKQLFCKHDYTKRWTETFQDLVGPAYTIEFEECLNCNKIWEYELPYVTLLSVSHHTKLEDLVPLPESAKRK